MYIDLDSAPAPLARLNTLVAMQRDFRDAPEYWESLEESEQRLANSKNRLTQQQFKKESPQETAGQREEQPRTAESYDSE